MEYESGDYARNKLMSLEEVMKLRPVDPDVAKRVHAETEAYIAVFPLVDIRETLGLSQGQLAKEARIKRKTVVGIERGKLARLKISTLQKYIEIFGGTIEIHARFGKKVYLISDSELLDAESDF
jgi:DNA-binding XRE family transcriptional regulator